jgi:pyruvate/2-oxoglutarate dehydrogenase complex dihydrolipoamide dehydrogenase (E3) component
MEMSMAKQLDVDLCIIGAGSGGLSVAAAAAQFNESVVLIEKARMGGDCLNYGCVPSKALIAAAKQAHAMETGEKFGISPQTAKVNFRKVHDHVHKVIAAIAPNDSVERFTGLGVKVIEAAGKFKNDHTVKAGKYEITARRFVVATGSSPGIPPIPGLKTTPYLTNESVFDLTRLPSHLIIIGGGPIGMELAQAHRRLGARVTVLEMFSPLGKDDAELTRIVLEQVAAEGVDIRGNIQVRKVSKRNKGVRIVIEQDGEVQNIDGSHLLVAAGRTPNLAGLDLEAAGIEFSPRGIVVNKRLKTSNRRVYAIGDVTGGLQFTHVANYHAGLVIRNALFKMPVKVDNDLVPWVTFTDPELSSVGLNEQMARKNYGDNIRVLRWPYAENDRAQAEHKTNGMVKVITTRRGRILGASIVGQNAGDLIQPWVLAITSGLGIKSMTAMIAPYPTFSEINKRVAYGFYTPSLNSPWLRRLIRLIKKLF